MKHHFLFITIIFVALLTSGCAPEVQPPGQPEVRNVLVIIGDDHSSRVVGCYGNRLIETPSIDALASEGTIFTNAYSNAPVCSASRQSLLTGKYPHATGVTLLTTAFRDDINTTLAEHLRDLGYITGVVGKTHFNNWTADPPDHGFTHITTHRDYRIWLEKQEMEPIPDSIETLGPWRPFRDSARIWLNADVLPTAVRSDYGSAAYDAAKAVEFLNAHKDTTFLLWVGFHEPHSPFNFPVEYSGKYDPADMPLPEGSPEDDRFVPAIFRGLSDADKRGIVASYYTSVEYMDAQVGRILNALQELGIEDETLVVYLGDQGYLLGDHKRFEKHTMWDPAIKAPLIFRVGDLKPKVRKSDELIQFIDVVPTILEIIGAPQMSEVQGRSMFDLINNRRAEGNDYVFAEFLVDNKAMVTDGKWKYIFTTGQRDLGQGYETGEGPSGILHRLYDLQNDPEETTDVSEFPGNEVIVQSLQRKMIGIFMETHPNAGEISDTLSIEEKLVWFCEPRDLGRNLNAK